MYAARVLAGLAARDDLEVEAFCAPGRPGRWPPQGWSCGRWRWPGRDGRLGSPGPSCWPGARPAGPGADLLHGVHYELPVAARLPQVVTSDPTLPHPPRWHEAGEVRWFGWAMR